MKVVDHFVWSKLTLTDRKSQKTFSEECLEVCFEFEGIVVRFNV